MKYQWPSQMRAKSKYPGFAAVHELSACLLAKTIMIAVVTTREATKITSTFTHHCVSRYRTLSEGRLGATTTSSATPAGLAHTP